MEKRYCDICGKETEKTYVKNSQSYEADRLRVVLTVSLDGKFSGDLCADCLLESIKKNIGQIG